MLSQYNDISDLVNCRIEIEHHNQYKVIDVLGYDQKAGTVLIEYMFRQGEHHAQSVSHHRIWNWITKAAQLKNRVI